MAKAKAPFLDFIRHVISGDEIVDHRDTALRVDIANARGHHFRFRQPDVAPQGMNLSVSVSDADIIHINQGNRANPGSCQRFRRPGAHAADTDHANMRVGKTLQRFFTI